MLRYTGPITKRLMWTVLAILFVWFWVAAGFYGAFAASDSPGLMYGVGVVVGIGLAAVGGEIYTHNKDRPED